MTSDTNLKVDKGKRLYPVAIKIKNFQSYIMAENELKNTTYVYILLCLVFHLTHYAITNELTLSINN